MGNELIFSLSPNFNIAAGHQVTGANSYFDWDGANAINPPDTNDPK